MKKYYIIFISLFSFVCFSQNDGSLDTSFGSGGIVINDAFTSTGADLTILSDGKNFGCRIFKFNNFKTLQS